MVHKYDMVTIKKILAKFVTSKKILVSYSLNPHALYLCQQVVCKALLRNNICTSLDAGILGLVPVDCAPMTSSDAHSKLTWPLYETILNQNLILTYVT